MKEQPKQNDTEKINELLNIPINGEDAINSLADQIAEVSKSAAKKDAAIFALQKRIIELEKDVKNLQEELKKNTK